MDFLVPHNDRLLVFAAANVTITPPSTPYPYLVPAQPLTALPQSLPPHTLTTGQGSMQVDSKEPGRTKRDVGTSGTSGTRSPWSMNTQQGTSLRTSNSQRGETNGDGGQRSRPGKAGQKGSGRTSKKDNNSGDQGGGNGSTNKKSTGIHVKPKGKATGMQVKSSREEMDELHVTSVAPEWRTYAGLGGKAVGVERKETGEVVRPEEETKEGDDEKAGYAKLPEDGQWSPLSPELLNYTIALIVFAIRYSKAYYSTLRNKFP